MAKYTCSQCGEVLDAAAVYYHNNEHLREEDSE